MTVELTAEQRAEQIVTSQRGLDAIREGDTFTLEILIREAIREAERVASQSAAEAEREACAQVAEAKSFDGSTIIEHAGIMQDIAALIRARTPEPTR